MMFTRDNVLKDLRDYVAEITFTKMNGENRVMRCTLKPDLLPEKYLIEEGVERDFHETHKDTVRAWDIKAAGWRSFKIDSVLYVQIIDAY